MKIYETDDMLIVFPRDSLIAYCFDKLHGKTFVKVKKELFRFRNSVCLTPFGKSVVKCLDEGERFSLEVSDE